MHLQRRELLENVTIAPSLLTPIKQLTSIAHKNVMAYSTENENGIANYSNR